MKKTPLITQYCNLKDQYDDCILFFRVGDFYEMFFDDARNASQALNIALTSHGKNTDVPMCGIPYHASESYISKMIHQGYKVALCEQTESVEDRFDKKQPLKRDVVRVITAGTLTESSMLDPKSYNFLICCSPIKKNVIGYAVLDLSVGDFFIEELTADSLKNVFSKWNPSECLLPESILNNEELWRSISEWHTKVQLIPDLKYNLRQSEINLKNLYKIETLESFGKISETELLASGFAAQYIMYTQKRDDIDLKPIIKINNSQFMHLDKFTRDNLEIIQTLQGSAKGSLFHALDDTITAVGGRLLKYRLTSPLKHVEEIQARLDSVECFVNNSHTIKPIKNHLSECDDLERMLGRVMLQRNSPLDLIKIANSLIAAENIYNIIYELDSPAELRNSLDALSNNKIIIQKIVSAVVSNPPLKTNEGGFIKIGYNSQLDELREAKSVCNKQIECLQEKYKEDTEIPTLKIRHSNMFGYCIEVPISQKKKVPYSFNEKQTLSTVSRYTTDTLTEINQKIFHADEEALKREMQVFEELNQFIKASKKSIICASKSIALIDVTVSLANKSIENKYYKPIIDKSNNFDIQNGRNPIVENILRSQKEDFTANNCTLNERKCLLMTGPNMAGKSTYLRQNALITLMAQAGSYIPAENSHIGAVDGIFVRIGASDNLSKGMSTFMTEMVEVACILNHATEHSLIVVDEVGRGTSTAEGEAIATAIMEDISKKRIRSLFATHYHELVKIADLDKNIFCMTMSIKDINDKLIFLHKVVEGSASKSYALAVCQMAGIPQHVINRSKEILENNKI